MHDIPAIVITGRDDTAAMFASFVRSAECSDPLKFCSGHNFERHMT